MVFSRSAPFSRRLRQAPRGTPKRPPEAHIHTGESSRKGAGQEGGFLAFGRHSKVSAGGYPHRYGGILGGLGPCRAPLRKAPAGPKGDPRRPPKAHSHTGGSSGKGAGQEGGFLAAGRLSRATSGAIPHRYGGILDAFWPSRAPLRKAPAGPKGDPRGPPKAHRHTGESAGKGTSQEGGFLATSSLKHCKGG